MTFVLLHGYTGSPDVWRDVVAALPAAERPLAPALWGHDYAREPSPIAFEAEVDRIAAEVAAGARGPVVLCGYSLGGRVALGVLARHPELAASAILIGASSGLATEAERRARAAADEAWCALAERSMDDFVDAWQAQPIFASQARLPKAVLDAQRAARLRHTGRAMAVAMRSLGLATMPDYAPALPRIAAPVRVMAGELDTKFTAIARAMAAAVPRGSVDVVRGVGHNVVLEAPQAIARALVASRSASEPRAQ